MYMRNQRFLVTGGAGFIGSHVVDHFLNSGALSVTVLDDFNDFYGPFIKEANVAGHLSDPRYRLVRADIRSRHNVREVFEKEEFSTIIHLAARAGVRPSLINPDLYQETNVGGTVNLLEEARIHGVKQFVLASSSSVYGPKAVAPFREDAPLAPISPYAATKAACELLAHTYSHLYDMRIVCLRFFTVYGARQRPDLAIHKFAQLISEERPIPVFGDGSTERDYTYIEDILRGIGGAIRYVSEDTSRFEVVNLGESHTVKLMELISMLEEALGRRAIVKRFPEQAGDVPRTHADISKAKRILGYQPVTPIWTGIQKFADWFKTNQLQSAVHV